MPLDIWDHTLLLATRHKRTHPALTPAGEGWYSNYLPRRDGGLSWPRCLITPGSGIEPMTARSEVRRPSVSGESHKVPFLEPSHLSAAVYLR